MLSDASLESITSNSTPRFEVREPGEQRVKPTLKTQITEARHSLDGDYELDNDVEDDGAGD